MIPWRRGTLKGLIEPKVKHLTKSWHQSSLFQKTIGVPIEEGVSAKGIKIKFDEIKTRTFASTEGSSHSDDIGFVRIEFALA